MAQMSPDMERPVKSVCFTPILKAQHRWWPRSHRDG
jgi:hypothetical protein